MPVIPKPVVDDEDVRKALVWLQEISTSSQSLSERIRAAQEHYRTGSVPNGNQWPDTAKLLLPDDRVASYLAQADALITDRRFYDMRLASKILPFIKTIGAGLELIREIEGAEERAKRMLGRANDHPDGGLFELVTAARYARDGFRVEFIPEGDRRMADLQIFKGRLNAHVECKRLRPSGYEIKENGRAHELFKEFESVVHDQHISVHVDVNFKVGLGSVPIDYLVIHTKSAIKSRNFQLDGHTWHDEYGEGSITAANVAAVHEDIVDSSLLFGPKMARLLTGKIVSDERYFMAIDANPRHEDPRYVDTLRYASVLTWNCLASVSIEARARHVTSKLADIDEQLQHAPLGIAHLGMDAERDIASADLRRRRNLDAVRNFLPHSRLFEIEIHYYLPRVSEISAWMIDETADTFSVSGRSLLKDPRLLGMDEPDLFDTRPAWHLPPPPIPV